MSESVIQIDTQAEIEKIIRQLDTLPNRLKAPDVLASALNATANEMKKKIGQRTRKRYAISNKKILTDRKMGGMYTKKATGSNGEATLFSRGGMLEVMNYMTRKNTETTAAMLKILNDSPMTALEVDGRKAFEATFQSGHTAIVQRMSNARLPIKNSWPRRCLCCTARPTRKPPRIITPSCKSTSSERWSGSWTVSGERHKKAAPQRGRKISNYKNRRWCSPFAGQENKCACTVYCVYQNPGKSNSPARWCILCRWSR